MLQLVTIGTCLYENAIRCSNPCKEGNTNSIVEAAECAKCGFLFALNATTQARDAVLVLKI